MMQTSANHKSLPLFKSCTYAPNNVSEGAEKRNDYTYEKILDKSKSECNVLMSKSHHHFVTLKKRTRHSREESHGKKICQIEQK